MTSQERDPRDRSVQKTRKQHFVPRLHLRHHATESGRIWGFDKRSGKIFATNIDDAAQKHNWLTIPDLDGEEGAGSFAEQYFQVFEGPAASAFRAILDAPRFQITRAVGTRYRSSLARYLAIQILRTPTARKRAVEMRRVLYNLAVEMAPSFGGLMPVQIDEEPPRTAEEERRAHADHVFDRKTVMRLAETLNDHVWILIRNDTGKPLYAADHPIGLHSCEEAHGLFAGLGYGSYGAQVVFPLSDKVVLELVERRWCAENIPALLSQDGSYAYSITEPKHLDYYRDILLRDSFRFVYCVAPDFDSAEQWYQRFPERRDSRTVSDWGMLWDGKVIRG